MSEIAITAYEIGKAYPIRHNTGKTYKTLQADLIGWLKAPFRRENTEIFWALKDISFEIKQGEVVGIIGRNGAGKSTLLKILSRITRPTTGYAELAGRVGSLLEVGTGFHPELTGRENIFLNGAVLGMDRVSIRRRFDEIVAFAEVEQFLDTPVKRYSSGMYMRLAFAVAAHLDPEILVVDEVLAVGDAEFQKKSMGKMSDVAQSGRTVLFVSHNMGAIEKLCTRAILLDRGKVITDGNIREAVTRYLSQSNLNEVTFENRAIKRVSIRQVGDWIELIADYEWKTPLALPSLGFVIRDFMGTPIFGTNPMVERVQPPEHPRTSGTVKVIIKSPHLLSGIYRLSIWFGNGYEDFFYEPDCLLLEIVNKSYVHSLPSSEVGSIVPECEWEFTG